MARAAEMRRRVTLSGRVMTLPYLRSDWRMKRRRSESYPGRACHRSIQRWRLPSLRGTLRRPPGAPHANLTPWGSGCGGRSSGLTGPSKPKLASTLSSRSMTRRHKPAETRLLRGSPKPGTRSAVTVRSWNSYKKRRAKGPPRWRAVRQIGGWHAFHCCAQRRGPGGGTHGGLGGPPPG